MYQLTFLPIAKKELAKLDFAIQKRIKEKLLLLCSNPETLKNNIKPLKGKYEGKFRLRVNQYRVIFTIKDNELIITVIRIRHRKEVY
jgi:mRNA interferase RelE/StbE